MGFSWARMATQASHIESIPPWQPKRSAGRRSGLNAVAPPADGATRDVRPRSLPVLGCAATLAQASSDSAAIEARFAARILRLPGHPWSRCGPESHKATKPSRPSTTKKTRWWHSLLP